MGNRKCINTAGWLAAQQKTKVTCKNKRIQNICNYNKSQKHCMNCDSVFEYDKRHNKFCSQSCSATFNNRGVDRHNKIQAQTKRYCIECNNELTDKRNGRKYCSRNCYNIAIKKKHIEDWINTGMYKKQEMTSVGWMYYLNLFDNKCSKCGWDKVSEYTKKSPLNIEHIDGDCTNNTPSNITVLCPSCHSLTSTYGILNRGNSKRLVRKQWRENQKLKG